jgi:hypothetical protein
MIAGPRQGSVCKSHRRTLRGDPRHAWRRLQPSWNAAVIAGRLHPGPLCQTRDLTCSKLCSRSCGRRGPPDRPARLSRDRQPVPKDADVLVTIDAGIDLDPVARLGRRLKGTAQTINLGADISLPTRRRTTCGASARRIRPEHAESRDGYPVRSGSLKICASAQLLYKCRHGLMGRHSWR